MEMRVQATSAAGDLRAAPDRSFPAPMAGSAGHAFAADDTLQNPPTGSELASARARARLTALIEALVATITGHQVALSVLTHDTSDGYRPAELLLFNGVPMDGSRALRLRARGRVVEETGNSEAFTLDLLCPDFPLTLAALPSGGVCRLQEAGETAATAAFTLETFGPPPAALPDDHHRSRRLFAQYAGEENTFLIARLSVLPATAPAARSHPAGSRFDADVDPVVAPHRLDDNA